MNKFLITILFGTTGFLNSPCYGSEPFQPADEAIPFIAYFASHPRGICVGTLVSRMAVITAAVCVHNPLNRIPSTRPITVVVGSHYRHPLRGVRVPVTKILIPPLSNDTADRIYLVQKSPALLILKRNVQDALVDIPLRPIEIDWEIKDGLHMMGECFITGWHFFYKGDRIYPVRSFLMQKSVHVQFVNMVSKELWCETLSIKYQKALDDLGYMGFFSQKSWVCVKDGMFGAPLVCGGKAVGLMTAPDAQWTNCTGMSNIIHRFDASLITGFMKCISRLFRPELRIDAEEIKKALFDSMQEDYGDMYGKLVTVSGESSDEDQGEDEEE